MVGEGGGCDNCKWKNLQVQQNCLFLFAEACEGWFWEPQTTDLHLSTCGFFLRGGHF